MPLQLIIKSATQSVEDFTLPCEMTWTIAQVKDQLSSSYPSKPKREQQKLIYGGKLLPDHLSLKSILNQTQDIHIIHLVCPSSDVPATEKAKQSVPPVCTTPPLPNASEVYSQMNNQVINSSLTSGLPETAWTSTYNTVSDPTQQYLAMQQMYVQMMSQYFAQMNGNTPYGPFLANTPPVQPPSTSVSRPNVPQNAPARQGEEEERDYIDYLHMFSRVSMLVALLLYYSSPLRVFGVFAMIFVLTMLARMNRQQGREEVQRATERPNESTEQASVDNQTSENDQAPETSNTESASAVPPNPTQPATSVPSTICTLITAFFSSLIPTDPLPVNVN